jgi:hypothetical protein
MVDILEVTSDNGADADRRLSLPTVVTIPSWELQQFPSPGTQRALKAETGKDYLALIGPDADSADRTQTQVWVHLRRTMPSLRWTECEDVALNLDQGAPAPVDPSLSAASEPSPPSAASGG